MVRRGHGRKPLRRSSLVGGAGVEHGLTADEENWDVTFRGPRSAAVEIRASRKSKLAAGTRYPWSAAVCLATLPDAAEQEATLVVRSLGPQIVQIKTRRLKLLPTAAAPAGQVQTARATYQYDPKTEAAPQPEPAIVLTAVGNESAAAWVWDLDLHSQVAADGTADHVLTYRIQNTGSRQIRLTLPEGLTRRDLHGVWVNDKPAAALGPIRAPEPPVAGELAVDLPEDLKFVTLVLRLATREKPLGTFARLQPPLPEIGLPVFARHWRLELPPGYATCSYGQDSPAAPIATFSLRRCLLGPLGRSENQPAFNPLRREDWQSALGWPAEDRRSDPAAGAGTTSGSMCPQSWSAAGWTQYPIDLDDGRATVIVVRRGAVDAAGWMLFLSLVGIGTWGLSRRPLALLSVAVVLGLPALLLPEAVAAIFSRGLLGVMFCLLLGLVRRMAAVPAVSTPGPELPSTLASFVPYGAPLLAAAMLGGWDSAGAGEPVKSPPPAHAVFIPVDANQKPTAGKYYLPEPFFDELYRRAALQAEKPQGWMIASAVYCAAMVEDPAQARHVVDRLTAEFEIHVFNAAGAPGTPGRVRIPLRREEVSLEPGQTQLDDRPVQPDWEADGNALLLEIAEPGEYRLQLTLRPAAQPGNRSLGPRSGDSPRADLAAGVQRSGGRSAGRVSFRPRRGPLGRSHVPLDRRPGPRRAPHRALAGCRPGGRGQLLTPSNCCG